MTTDETAPLNQYLQPLFDNKRLVAIVTLVAIALGVIVGVTASKAYTSNTAILVYPISGDPTKALESDDTEVEMATELRIATSQAVISVVAEKLESQSIVLSEELIENSVAASTTKESRILDIAFEGATPEIAQAGAAAFAESYLEFRADIANSNKLASQAQINGRVVILKEQLSDVTVRLNATPETSSSRVVLEVEETSIKGELTAQQSALADLSTLAVDATRVIDIAHLPIYASGLTLVQILVGSVAAGLVLGIISAYVLAAFTGANQPHNRRIADKQTPQLMESLQGVMSAMANAAPTDDSDEEAVEASDPTPEAEPVTTVAQTPAAAPAPAAAPEPAPTPDPMPAPTPAALDPVPAAAAVQAVTAPSSPQPAPELAEAGPETSPAPIAAMTPAATEPQDSPLEAPEASQPEEADIPDALRGRSDASEQDASEALVVSGDMEDLIRAIQYLGTVGPVVGLSVGETSGATALAVAFDLAGELQSLGARVLIIDAAIEDPMLHSLLRVDAGPGLADVLAGSTTLQDAAQPFAGLDGLDALTIGTTTMTTAQDLVGEPLDELLTHARADYHSVLIVGSIVHDEATVPSLAARADGLIISTGQSAGDRASVGLCARLEELPVATLDIISTASRIEEAIVGASSM